VGVIPGGVIPVDIIPRSVIPVSVIPVSVIPVGIFAVERYFRGRNSGGCYSLGVVFLGRNSKGELFGTFVLLCPAL
jgi:hypothetical protein